MLTQNRHHVLSSTFLGVTLSHKGDKILGQNRLNLVMANGDADV